MYNEPRNKGYRALARKGVMPRKFRTKGNTYLRKETGAFLVQIEATEVLLALAAFLRVAKQGPNQDFVEKEMENQWRKGRRQRRRQADQYHANRN